MDWDDLRYVLAIARQGNLSRAASYLGVTRTTVGRRLRAIESGLGVRLFDRSPEGFAPTAAGQDMCELADQMEADVLSLEGRVLGRDVQLEGKLRVSTIDFQFACFHAAFASFVDRYPRVDLTVSMSNEAVSLTRREADVALRLTSAPPEHLVGRKVADVRYAAYGCKALVERIGRDAPYTAFPWLHLDERMNPRRLDGWLAKNAPGARIAMRLDSGNSIREAIRAGIGVQLLATYDGDADPDLVRIGAVQDDAHGLWLLTLPELRSTSRVRAFMEHMVDALRARLADLEASA
ncbi:MAG: DNA-binding transcriptional LysR family regulator [Myxococcota bacterium]|jgi:DNA-binding transcriptional LysR family regulator